MLEILKKSERKMNASEMLSVFRKCGWQTKGLGRYMKWKDLPDGSRLSVHIDVYQITDNTEKHLTSYVMADTLGRFMHNLTLDKTEIFNWLKEKGYKPEKKWWLEDGGMTEEVWNAWNSNEEI
jgi:hypothetical protein